MPAAAPALAPHYPIAEIARRLHERRLILFVGAGLSMPYLPNWTGLLENLRDSTFRDDPAGHAEVSQLLASKQFLAAAWAIEQKARHSHHDWRDYVQDLCDSTRKPTDPASQANLALVQSKYAALCDLPFASIVTTNYDRFLEAALNMSAVTHDNTEELIDLLRKPKLLKLHGDAATRKSLILTSTDFRAMKHDRPELVFTMEAAAKLNSFLFIGYSMQDEDLMGWLERVCHRSLGKTGGHYALINPKDFGPYRRQLYRDLYDIQMVDAPLAQDGHPDYIRFLNDLRLEWRLLCAEPVPEQVRLREEEDKWLEKDLYVDPQVIPVLDFKSAKDAKPNPESLDAVLNRWLANDKSSLLILLGEFGTGKSWFSLRAREIIRQTGKRAPRRLRLGSFKQGATPADIAGAFGENFLEANTLGKLVVILDAFDEMGRAPGKSLKESFAGLASLAAGNAKVIITCRKELFRTGDEQDEIVGDKISVKGADKFEVLPFDEARIKQALKLRSRESIWDWIKGDEALTELASRPVLLDLILAWPGHAHKPTLCQLYENAVLEVLRRGEDTPDPLRRQFAEELAWRIQQSGSRTIASTIVEDMARNILGQSGEDPVKVLKYMSRSLLVRRVDDYEFGHLSFQEYLVAEQIRPDLMAGHYRECKLSNPTIAFIREKWHWQPPPVKEKDGMVWVPPGPFICGEGDEARVENLTEGCWMDKYLVTNAQFQRFLKDQKNVDPDWIKHERSRIKEGFKLEDAKYADHPVTGVTWHGANAFAKSHGKQLPNDLQWEKAARGADGRAYPWGDAFDKNKCNTRESGRRDTSPVNQYQDGVSPYGCLDVAGNVWEWMENDYRTGNRAKAVRGGSWNYNSSNARCAVRYSYVPDYFFDYIGFRCARTTP